MIVALVVKGPNSVRIPMMFWSDYDTALGQVTKLLGQPISKDYWGIWQEHYFHEREEWFENLHLYLKKINARRAFQ